MQIGVVETVIVDQGMKSISPSIPEVPDKRAVVKELGVLLEEFIAQPVFEGFGFAALETGAGNERPFVEGAERSGEELAQAGSGGLLAVDRRKTNDAVFSRRTSLIHPDPRAGQSGKLLPVWRGHR